MEMETDETIDVEAFEQDYKDAQAYHERAIEFLNGGFRSSLVFNIAAVALERYLVALCDLHDLMPRNHNYICMMLELEPVMAFPKELIKEIKSMDLIFGICSIEDYRHPNPDKADMDRILKMCNDVQHIFTQPEIASLIPPKSSNNIKQ